MRLAERSLGVGEVVRPRTASLFEAAQALEPLELVEEREAAPAPPRAARRREAVPVSTPRDESPAPAAPLSQAVVVEREAEAAVAEQPSPAPSEPLPAAPAPPVAEQATEPLSPARGGERDSNPEAPPPPTVVVRDRRPAVRPRPRPQEGVSGSEPQGRVGGSPLALPLSVPAPERFAGPPAADEPPVVRVTIGRVDVRAVLPAAPPERARPKRPPRLTLDEYLREGRRP